LVYFRYLDIFYLNELMELIENSSINLIGLGAYTQTPGKVMAPLRVYDIGLDTIFGTEFF
jgi:hypothetical protein